MYSHNHSHAFAVNSHDLRSTVLTDVVFETVQRHLSILADLDEVAVGITHVAAPFLRLVLVYHFDESNKPRERSYPSFPTPSGDGHGYFLLPQRYSRSLAPNIGRGVRLRPKLAPCAHLGLAKDTPASRPITICSAAGSQIHSLPRLGGLQHRYAVAA